MYSRIYDAVDEDHVVRLLERGTQSTLLTCLEVQDYNNLDMNANQGFSTIVYRKLEDLDAVEAVHRTVQEPVSIVHSSCPLWTMSTRALYSHLSADRSVFLRLKLVNIYCRNFIDYLYRVMHSSS